MNSFNLLPVLVFSRGCLALKTVQKLLQLLWVQLQARTCGKPSQIKQQTSLCLVFQHVWAESRPWLSSALASCVNYCNHSKKQFSTALVISSKIQALRPGFGVAVWGAAERGGRAHQDGWQAPAGRANQRCPWPGRALPSLALGSQTPSFWKERNSFGYQRIWSGGSGYFNVVRASVIMDITLQLGT